MGRACVLSKDLSQNPSPDVKRGRCSTVDGSLPTFATSSGLLYLYLTFSNYFFMAIILDVFFNEFHIIRNCFFFLDIVGAKSRWSQKHGRPLCGDEMLGIMGLPVTQSLANATSSERVIVTMLSESAKVTLIFLWISFLFWFILP